MSVTIEMPADTQARVEAEAVRRGISFDQLIAELADALPKENGEPARRRLAFVGAGASKAAITHQIDELLARPASRARVS